LELIDSKVGLRYFVVVVGEWLLGAGHVNFVVGYLCSVDVPFDVAVVG